MTEAQTQFVPPPEVPRKEALTGKEMENLIASVGNSESKAVTLLVMKPQVIYSSFALQQEVIKAQGPNPTWKIDHRGVDHYCERSFEPIGLVAGEVTDELSRRVGWVKTKYGEEISDPFAALLADFSLRHPNLSLYSLFGATLSSGKGKEVTDDDEYRKRAVNARLKLFWELTTADLPVRVTDLGAETGEDRAQLARHLRDLGRFGVVQYDAIKFGEHFTGYKVTEKGLEGIANNYRTDIPSITPQLVEVLANNKDKWLSREELGEKIAKLIHGETQDPSSYEKRVGMALHRWMRSGFVVTEDFTGDFRSTVNLAEQQRNDLIELLELLDQFQKQTPEVVQKGRDIAKSLSPNDIANLLEKAKQSSPFANREPVENFGEELSVILSEKSGLTAVEITRILNEQCKQISPEGIRVRLKKLEQRGLIQRSSSEKNAKWSLKSAKNPFSDRIQTYA